MPIVRRCSHPECLTLTMGELCAEHEPAKRPAAVRRNLDAAAAAALEALRETPATGPSSP